MNKKICFNCGKIKEDYESAYCDKCWEEEQKRLNNKKMKTIEVKADKKYINYINRLLQDINFDDESLEMQKLIKELNARQDDSISLFSIDINKDYVLTIDIISDTYNYYDNIVIWKKGKTELDYREVACLECNFEIGDITLEKEYFDFLNEDYMIKFIY